MTAPESPRLDTDSLYPRDAFQGLSDAYESIEYKGRPRYYFLSFCPLIDVTQGSWLVLTNKEDGSKSHFLALEDCKAGERGSFAMCASPPVWVDGKRDGKPFKYLAGMAHLYDLDEEPDAADRG